MSKKKPIAKTAKKKKVAKKKSILSPELQDKAARQLIREGARATKGKRQVIQLLLGDGKTKQPMSATVFDYLAVHKEIDRDAEPIDGLWTITHIPSGLGFPDKYDTRREASEVTWLMNQKLDHSNAKELDIAEIKRRFFWYGGRTDDIPFFLLSQVK